MRRSGPYHQLVKLLGLTGTCSESAAWDRGGRVAPPSPALAVLPPPSCWPPSGTTCVFAYGDDDDDDVSAARLPPPPPLLLLPPPPSLLGLRCNERRPRKFVFLGLGDSAEPSPGEPVLSCRSVSFDVSVGELGQEGLLEPELESPPPSPTSCSGVGTDLQRSFLALSLRPFCRLSTARGEVALAPEAGWDWVLRSAESRGRLPNSGADLLNTDYQNVIRTLSHSDSLLHSLFPPDI